MTKHKAIELTCSWFDNIKSNTDIPLFKTEDDGLRLIPNEQNWLQRSQIFTDRLNEVRDLVIKSKVLPEGICYLIYRRDTEESVDPLYVGIAECVGKKGNVSALFSRAGWMRFDHRPKSNGHICNINEALISANHPYSTWVNAMFDAQDEEGKITLKNKLYVHVDIWTKESVSIIRELGNTPLFVEEKIRIWTLSQAGYSRQLLNRDGNRHLITDI